MKVLHTADWHMGKKLHGYDLLPDQAYILDQILKIAKEEIVEAIVSRGIYMIVLFLLRRVFGY